MLAAVQISHEGTAMSPAKQTKKDEVTEITQRPVGQFRLRCFLCAASTPFNKSLRDMSRPSATA
jgi:hypothetical protein